jgi:hypothetical protein
MKDEFQEIMEECRKSPHYKIEGAKIEFCENLLKIMEEHKLTKKKVAEMLGIDHKSLKHLFK